jgi:3',5'-cyclic AMP phosphodiesterase CpdA
MRTIAHLSDLHFGREDVAVVEGLVAELTSLRPSLVAVSGDLTQRAREGQFRAARRFLDRLPFPKVVVPGNHDVPLWDLPRRILSPLGRYRRLVEPDLEPVFEDDALLVRGVSTARSATWKSGRISHEQIDRLRAAFCAPGKERLRVLVAHHPFTPPRQRPDQKLTSRARRALHELAECGLDLLLTGHLHQGSHEDARDHFERLSRSVLALHAGSATSDRLRGEDNSYNLVVADGPRLEVTVRAWDGARFVAAAARRWARDGDAWVRVDERTGTCNGPATRVSDPP